MSANVDLDTEVIQHIDDVCDDYNDGFAPKAQEEILSETLDSTQACDSSKNISEEALEKSESADVSNEDINEASNELVREVITDVESDINAEEDQGIHENDEEKLEINADNSPDSELNGELNDADEADVIMGEPDATIDSDTENKVIGDAEVVNDEDNTVEITNEESNGVEVTNDENNIIEITNDESNIAEITNDEIEMKESTQLSSNDVEDEIINEVEQEVEQVKPVDDVVAQDEPVTEVEEAEESKPNEDDHNVEASNEIKEENIAEPTENDTEIINQVKSENEAPAKPHSQMKGVKSLSTTYGHDENLTNGDCCICNKIVYPMEKLVTNDRLFHKTCFRCTKCKNALSAGNFTFNHGKPYCTPHYVELFKKRGRYDEIDDKIETELSTTTGDVNEDLADELPAPDTTKNILAKFRDLESGGGNNVNQSTASDLSDELPAPNTTKNMMERFTALGQEKVEAKCKPKIDIPRHTNGHSNGTSENIPVVLSKDVVRSNDPAQDDLPEQGITKNLVNQFRKMESLANN